MTVEVEDVIRTSMDESQFVTNEKNREAAFLARQNDRLSKLKDGTQNDPSQEESKTRRKDFWREFKQVCQSLHDQLDKIKNDEKKEGSKNVVTAAQRNTALSKLHSVQATIAVLSSYYSQASSATKLHSKQKNCIEKNNILPKELTSVEIYTELPPADLRFLEQEFKGLAVKAQDISNFICPKEKFRFKRYHEVLLKKKGFDISAFQRECQNNNSSLASNKDSHESKVENDLDEKRDQFEFDGLKLVGYKHCSVSLRPDGTYTMIDCVDETKVKHGTTSSEPTLSSAFLIRDLDQCNVNMSGKYNSVHIINVSNGSKVCIADTVTGPIHVTNCNDITIISASRQLRIHDCKNVRFHIDVFSGPIIEDCTNMTFNGDYFDKMTNILGEKQQRQAQHENMFWDVKDFNWLKTSVPSPNYKVIGDKKEIIDTKDRHLEFMAEENSHSNTDSKNNESDSDEESEDEL